MNPCLPPQAAEKDRVRANAIENIFVLSTPPETNALAYRSVKEIILPERGYPITAYFAPPGITCHGVIRRADADFTDADLKRMIRTACNPKVLGARRIKNTTTVIILFDGHKVPNYVYCGPIMQRRRQRNKQRTTPEATTGPSPKTGHQPTTTAVPQLVELTQPSSSRAQAAFKPMWADKVTRNGETRTPPRTKASPQPVVEKIQFLARENAIAYAESSLRLRRYYKQFNSSSHVKTRQIPPLQLQYEERNLAQLPSRLMKSL
ncbi:hypothetical protein HPB51_020240 [Rhipicephalus microplus]|uniref:Uncharacterized protein n=1 Tax=Rhipicephalus microplus TaxID=6941 RepID=A0A9J6F5J4_RHIMP|nr:hypothetical protein HPB51_020240 [Rhipicephalus microplus]